MAGNSSFVELLQHAAAGMFHLTSVGLQALLSPKHIPAVPDELHGALSSQRQCSGVWGEPIPCGNNNRAYPLLFAPPKGRASINSLTLHSLVDTWVSRQCHQHTGRGCTLPLPSPQPVQQELRVFPMRTSMIFRAGEH